ncbi:GntR family transcriptional regulator [Roseibium sp.]|uniref:GntR family transcriptional regulator n=1 Tax=Roseibium sp. TaxID=1936156 RepID=UPI003A96FAA9
MSEPNLADEIAVRLRRDILRGKLPPDAPIKERDNASELGVSRTPMREAIRMLAKEGLVILRPSRSPIVARPSFKEISDQVAVLLVLEKLSAELACVNATETDLEELRAINQRMSDCYDQADPLDLFEIDMGFHTAIAKASHNTSLAETHRAYLARLWRARFLAASQKRNRARVVGEHRVILDALEAHDVEAVRAGIDWHLGHLADDIRPIIEDEQRRHGMWADNDPG